MAAQGVHAAACSADVSEQKLNHRGGADDLRSESMLRPADGVDDRRNFLRVPVLADGSEHVNGLQILIFRNAGNALDHFRRVSRILLLQQLEDAAWMLQRHVVGHIGRQQYRWCRSAGFSGHRFWSVTRSRSGARTSPRAFIVPGGLIVAVRGGVKSGIEPILRKFESILNNESRVGVIDEIFFGDAVVLDGVPDQAAKKSNVGTRAYLAEKVSGRGSAGKSRIDGNQL